MVIWWSVVIAVGRPGRPLLPSVGANETREDPCRKKVWVAGCRPTIVGPILEYTRCIYLLDCVMNRCVWLTCCVSSLPFVSECRALFLIGTDVVMGVYYSGEDPQLLKWGERAVDRQLACKVQSIVRLVKASSDSTIGSPEPPLFAIGCVTLHNVHHNGTLSLPSPIAKNRLHKQTKRKTMIG